MNVFVTLVFMVFLHCFYDFHLQGILASMKQRDWWQLQMDMQKHFFVDLEKEFWVNKLIQL